jgi:hypothetical protein
MAIAYPPGPRRRLPDRGLEDENDLIENLIAIEVVAVAADPDPITSLREPEERRC